MYILYYKVVMVYTRMVGDIAALLASGLSPKALLTYLPRVYREVEEH